MKVFERDPDAALPLASDVGRGRTKVGEGRLVHLRCSSTNASPAPFLLDSRLFAKAKGADGLPLYAAEAPSAVRDSPDDDEAALFVAVPVPVAAALVALLLEPGGTRSGRAALEPVGQLILGPVAAGDEEEAPRAQKTQDALAISLAGAATEAAGVVIAAAEADGVKGAFVEDEMPAAALSAVQHGVERSADDVPAAELGRRQHRRARRGLGVARGGDLAGQGNALGAVVYTQGAAGPAVVAQGEEQGAVSAAEVEEGGGMAIEGGGRRRGRGRGRGFVFIPPIGSKISEKRQDLALGVGVVEPDGANVGRVGGVVGQLGCV